MDSKTVKRQDKDALAAGILARIKADPKLYETFPGLIDVAVKFEENMPYLEVIAAPTKHKCTEFLGIRVEHTCSPPQV